MRRIQAPGIEINEIDKSAYNEQFDESLVDTTSLMCGFADKGQDYEPQYINSMNQFIDAYGYPTNEAERYFYYGAKEVLDNRGQLICAKLPYDNNVLDKICYTTYSLNNKLVEISTVFSIINQDLLNINLSVHQVIPDNSFFDVLNMVKLGKTGFESLAEFNNEKISKYSEDLIDFAFNTCNVSLDRWNTYEKYCKSSFVGVHTFLKLLNYKIPSERDFEQAIETDLNNYLKDEDNYPYTNVHADIPLQNFSDLEDLEKIAIKMYKTYKDKMAISENGESISSLFDYIAKDFVMQKSLFQIKQYFYDLGSYIEPYFNEIKEHDDTDFQKWNSNHYWKIDFSNLSNYIDNERDILSYSYGDIRNIDDTITSYVELKSLDSVDIRTIVEKDGKTRTLSTYNTGFISINDFDKLKVNQAKVPENTLRIYDISRTNYVKNSDNDLECLGILPVVTTAANALYFQKIAKDQYSAEAYNVMAKIQTVFSKGNWKDISENRYYDVDNNDYMFDSVLSCTPIKSGYSDIALQSFPILNYTASHHIDRNYLKQIGIVVFKMTKSPTTNRIQLLPVESFVGSLDYNGKDFGTKAQNFIDFQVNDKSKYINVFSNFKFNDQNYNVKNQPIDDASMFMIKNQTATSLGFYEKDCYKYISLKNSISKPLDRIFDTLRNIDTINIDLVIDGGVSTIAQYIVSTKIKSEKSNNIAKRIEDELGYYDIHSDNSANFNITNQNSTSTWRSILQKYDNFCKNVRKDCMFLADALRPTCITGDQKNIRSSAAGNDIFNTVIQSLRYQINLNTSYGAGYCNWCYVFDNISNMYFWLPPSINAAGKYIYTDTYFNYWDAPAGLNRGILENTYGIAFNPTNDEAGYIYNQSWNYAIQYPIYGYVIEGQKTFQLEKTAFDRVNVRRLFLKMEKLVYRIAKRFCYEGNTSYMRQRFVDTIRPIFEEAIQGSGISEYVIICDERNNKTINIENHELHCTIAVRPVKTIEFIVLNFIAMPQSGSFTEETILNMTPYYS